MKLYLWAASEDGSSHYRYTLPAAALGWQGHEVATSKVLPPSWARKAEVMMASRLASPNHLKLWRELRERGIRLVMDYDDDYFSIHPSNTVAYDFWQGERLELLAEATRTAHRVTVASSGLAEAIRRHTGHPDIRVVPNGLHAGILSTVRDYRRTPLTVGWAGTASTVTDLDLAARALSRCQKLRTPTGVPRVRLVGTTLQRAVEAGFQPEQSAAAVEWVDGHDRYLATVSEFDIWVAPYRSYPYNDAKFPTKALEAAFLGIPLIASDTPPYRDWVAEHGSSCGLQLASEPHEFGRWIKMLVEDAELRRSMGHAGRSTAARYTLQSLAPDWEAALTQW